MKKYVLFLVLFMAHLCVNAQTSDLNNKKKDSLFKSAKTTKNNLDLSRIYLELSEVYSFIDLDSVNYFAIKSERAALKALKGEKDPKKIEQIKETIAGASNNRGYAYFNKGDFPSALIHHKKALDKWKELKNDDGIGKSLNNLGVIYRQLGKFHEANKFFEDALEIYEKQGDIETVALLHNNLGGIYKMLEKNSEAFNSYRTALFLRRKIGDKRGEAVTMNNIGSLHKKLNNLDSAFYYFNQSLNLIEAVGDQMGIAHASCNIGEMAIIQKDFSKAAKMGERALNIGKSLGANMVIEQSSGLLERVYQLMGNWKGAYEMQKLKNEITAKIKGEEARNAANKMELQYEYEKQKEIDDIKREKERELTETKDQIQELTIYFISLLLFLLLIFIILLYRRYRITLKQNQIIEKQNNERKIMLQEIHHRVKNNFQIISSMLRLQTNQKTNPEVKESFNEAINRIHTMSIVHEIIYRQDALDMVNVKEYLENLIDNLCRSFDSGRVKIEIRSCQESLDLEHTIPLGIIVNELITNSFKHAFDETIQDPKIYVELEHLDGQFILHYKDNGVGFKPGENKSAFGLELIDTMIIQISGQIKFCSEPGWNTCYKISFK